MLSALRPASCLPRYEIAPAFSDRKPETQLSNVVLPEPLGPITPLISPAPTVRSTPSRARLAPNHRFSPEASSTGSPLAGGGEALPLMGAAGIARTGAGLGGPGAVRGAR